MPVQLHTRNNVVPDRIGSTFNPAADPAFLFAHDWRTLTDPTMPTPPEGYELTGWTYEQDPNDAQGAIIVATWGSIAERLAREAQAEVDRQAGKIPERRQAENAYLDICDKIRGDTAHTPLTPKELFVRYSAAIGGAQEQAATRLIIKALLCLVALDPDRETYWHGDTL